MRYSLNFANGPTSKTTMRMSTAILHLPPTNFDFSRETPTPLDHENYEGRSRIEFINDRTRVGRAYDRAYCHGFDVGLEHGYHPISLDTLTERLLAHTRAAVGHEKVTVGSAALEFDELAFNDGVGDGAHLKWLMERQPSLTA